jgi:uncharacterized protein
MRCVIYKSSKWDQAYLYIEEKDNFTRVPVGLLNHFGKPIVSMMLSLDKHQKLALADIEKVRNALNQQGFYLQIPPLPESL